MFRSVLAVALLAAGSFAAVNYIFNDYEETTAGDRSSTSFLNRHAVAGNLQYKTDSPTDNVNYQHLFSPGQFSVDNRRRCGYYYNPGIQEFARAGHSADSVQAAYIWGHQNTFGMGSVLYPVKTFAATMYIDSVSDPAIWFYDITVPNVMLWSNMTNPSYCLSTPDDNQIKGGNTDYNWTATLADCIAAQHAYNVTAAVKYIMNHPTPDSIGIWAQPQSGQDQYGYPADESNSNPADQQAKFGILLSIVYGSGAITSEVNSLAIESSARKATALALWQNSPNPFTAGTTVKFSVPVRSQVKVAVYSSDGKLVKTLVHGAAQGVQSVRWDGANSVGNPVNSGIYICKLIAGNRSITKKMIVIR